MISRKILICAPRRRCVIAIFTHRKGVPRRQSITHLGRYLHGAVLVYVDQLMAFLLRANVHTVITNTPRKGICKVLIMLLEIFFRRGMDNSRVDKQIGSQ